MCAFLRFSFPAAEQRTRGLSFTPLARRHQGREYAAGGGGVSPYWSSSQGMQSMAGVGVGLVSGSNTCSLLLILPLSKHLWDSGGGRLCQNPKKLQVEARKLGLCLLRSRAVRGGQVSTQLYLESFYPTLRRQQREENCSLPEGNKLNLLNPEKGAD